MSEYKRFDVYTELLHTGIGITDKGKELTGNDVVTLLNQLTNENDELKANCKNYEWYKAYKKLLNENEQLKHDKILYEVEKMIDNKIEFLQKDIKELRKCINPYPVKEEGITRG